MRRLAVWSATSILGLLPAVSRAGLDTFHWVPDPDPLNPSDIPDPGTLILSVPGRDPGEPFGPADRPALVDLWFTFTHSACRRDLQPVVRTGHRMQPACVGAAVGLPGRAQ
jgi:hypothetical protein